MLPTRDQLVLVDVERPHRDRSRGHALEHLTIDLELQILGEFFCRPIHQQEFGTIQADAIGALMSGRDHIGQEFDVRLQPYRHTVSCLRFFPGRNRAEFGSGARLPLHVGYEAGRRVQHQRTLAAINHDERPRYDSLAGIVQTNDGGHVK